MVVLKYQSNYAVLFSALRPYQDARIILYPERTPYLSFLSSYSRSKSRKVSISAFFKPMTFSNLNFFTANLSYFFISTLKYYLFYLEEEKF